MMAKNINYLFRAGYVPGVTLYIGCTATQTAATVMYSICVFAFAGVIPRGVFLLLWYAMGFRIRPVLLRKLRVIWYLG